MSEKLVKYLRPFLYVNQLLTHSARKQTQWKLHRSRKIALQHRYSADKVLPMKFEITDQGSAYFIQAYREQKIIIDERTYTSSLVLVPNQLIPDWPVTDCIQLNEKHFNALLELKPDLILLGTGNTQQFPAAKLYSSLINAGIGVEVMTTTAACRTYNILAAEGRRVVAALILENS